MHHLKGIQSSSLLISSQRIFLDVKNCKRLAELCSTKLGFGLVQLVVCAELTQHLKH